jgi:signal transduction histidine kinase/integral membrane sensor domain MASE1
MTESLVYPSKSLRLNTISAVAAAYFIFGAMGLSLAIPPGYASPIFPAAGLAVALMLCYGNRVWPGIWVGSFVLNLSVSWLNADLNLLSACVAFGIASGATLQALFASYLVSSQVGQSWQEMELESDIIRSLLLAGVIGCIVSASIGVSVLYLAGIISSSAYVNSWWSWWVGDTLGVLVVMPLALSLFYRKHPSWRRRLKTVGIPMMFVLVAVAGVVALASSWELNFRKDEIKKHGEAFEKLIQQRYIAHREAIAALARLIEVMPDMTFAQFEYFTRITLRDHPDIFALSYNPYVVAAERNAFEAHMSKVGAISDFKIKERNQQSVFVEAAKRDIYVPVGFIAPLNGNQDAIGFDINSDSNRQDAIEQVLRSGDTAITAPIKLVQEQQNRIGVLILSPAFSNRSNPDVKDSVSSITGFATGVIKVDELINIATASAIEKDLVYQIDDKAAPQEKQTLYRSKLTNISANDDYSWHSKLAIADRIWTLKVSPTNEYINKHPRPLAWIISIVGLFFTALLQVLMLVITGRTNLVERKVHEQTHELHLKRDALQDSNAQLNTLFKLSPDGFVALSSESIVQFVNPAFEAITGISSQDILQQHVSVLDSELKKRTEFPQQYSGVGQYFSDKVETQTQHELVLQSPSKVVLQIIGMYSDASNVSKILYLRDITSEAEVANLKTEFISHAAHELRTPMTSIYGYIELLLKKKFDEKLRREMLEAMQRQAELIVKMINELLDLARIDARGGKDFNFAAVNVNSLLSKITADLKLEKASSKVLLDLPASEVMINGDLTKIRQAIMNVLTNAEKYSPKGKAINIALLIKAIEVGIEVRDQGIGMSTEQLKHVGERFWRADRSGSIPGTGLGMSIVKEIVEFHGGRVEIKSTPNIGTTVILWLPRM